MIVARRFFLVLLLSCLAGIARGQATIPLFFEKAYLHTDRDVYAQGDTLWFKAYLVNAQDNKPINSSHTLYVELIAPDSAKILNREIIRMDNGLGNGDISLADTLAPGKYRLRAYTNWIRNFGNNLVFEKTVTILNVALAAPTPPPAAVTTDNKGKDKNKAIFASAITPAAAKTFPRVRFYPEGGSLVEGISSIVGVKAEDGYGAGIPVSGAVLSSTGDTVSRFSCDSLGIGLLALLPVPGQSYHAVVNLPGGRNDVFQLPAALSKGLTLQIRQTDSVIHAIINNTDTPGTGSINYRMVIKHTGKTFLNQALPLQHLQTPVKIPTTNLPEGISVITLYDTLGKPNCERLVYIHHPLNENKMNLLIKTASFRPKEQTAIDIQAPPGTKLSLAVVDASMINQKMGNITSYLQLQSEIKGSVERPDRYFDTANIYRFKQLDMLLLTQGWRDFVWRRLADTAIRISYAAESGISVSGKIWDEVLNKMLPGLNVSLHADGAKGIKQFSAISGNGGDFHFDDLILYGKQNVQLAAIDNKGKQQGSFMVDTLSPLAVKTHISDLKPLSSKADSAAKLTIEKSVKNIKNAQIRNVTKLKEVTIKSKQSVLLNNASVLTSWGPDQIFDITPEDYQYNTLEWFLQQRSKGAIKPMNDPNRLITPHTDNSENANREMREFMRPLTGLAYMGVDTFMYKVNSNYSWRAKTKPIPPNIIVNGRELDMDNYEQAEAYRITYFNMPMNKFKKVVLKHMIGTLHGAQKPIMPNGMNIPWGIVETIPVDRYLLYLTLKENATIDNPGNTSTDIDGYYQARTFYQPAANAKPSLADYRTTIHWEPNIITDAKGKATVSFYNTAQTGKVRVVAQGLTPEGSPLTTTTVYEVK